MPPNPFSRDPAVTVGVDADTDSFNSEIDGAVDSLGSLKMATGAVAGALGALATGALAKATQAAADFEQALVEVEKVTSPETAEEMAGAIRDMATEIPLAQEELAGLAADAGRFGIRGSENIRAFTESVARMAEATDLSAEQAGESMARLATLTNTPVSEIENLGSSINSLSNDFATSSSEIVDSMLRASGSLSQLGLDQRQIAGLSASLNAVSESSERAGTRLRRLGQELLNPKKVGDLANALGMTEQAFRRMREESPNQLIRQMIVAMGEGGAAADRLRKTLSTTSRQALAGLSQNLEGVRRAQDLANTSFEEGTSLQREFDAATDTFNAKLQLLRNRLGNVAIEIGNVLLPPLTDLLEDVNGLVAAFSDWNSRMNGVPATIGLVATSVGGLSAGAATLASHFGVLTPALSAAGTALGGLSAPLVAAGAAVAGFAAVATGNFDKVIDAVNGLRDRVDSAIGSATSYLKGQGQTDIKGGFRTLGSGIRGVVTNILDFLTGTGPASFVATISTIVSYLKTDAASDLQTAARIAYRSVTNAAAAFLGGLTGTGGGDGPAEASINTAIEAVRSYLINTAPGQLQHAARAAFDVITTVGGNVIDDLITAGSSIIKSGIRAAVTWLTETAPSQLRSAAQSAFDTITTAAGNTIDDLITAGSSVIKSGIQRVVTFIRGIGREDVKAAFKALGSGIRTVLLTVFNGFLAAGGAIAGFVTDFATYIESGRALTDLKDAFDTLVVGIGTALTTGFDLFLAAGGAIAGFVTDFVTYIESGQAKQDIEAAFDTLVVGIGSVVGGGLQAMLDVGGAIGGFVGDLVTYVESGQAYTDIKAAFDTLVNDVIMAAFEGLYEGLIGKSLIPEMFGAIDDYVTSTGKSMLKKAFGGVVTGIENALAGIDLSGIEDTLSGLASAAEDAINWIDDIPSSVSIDWPEPPSIVKKALNGNLNIDWPRPPWESGGDGGDGGDGGGDPGGSTRRGDTGFESPGAGAPTDPDEGQGEDWFGFGNLDLPFLQTGGMVEETGLAVVHAGERVIPPAEASPLERFGGGSRLSGGRGGSGDAGETLRRGLDDMRESIEGFAQWAREQWSDLREALDETTAAMVDQTTRTFERGYHDLGRTTEQALDGVGRTVRNALRQLRDRVITPAWDSYTQTWTQGGRDLVRTTRDAFGSMGSLVDRALTEIGRRVGSVRVAERFGREFEQAFRSVDRWMGRAVDRVERAVARMQEALSGSGAPGDTGGDTATGGTTGGGGDTDTGDPGDTGAGGDTGTVDLQSELERLAAEFGLSGGIPSDLLQRAIEATPSVEDVKEVLERGLGPGGRASVRFDESAVERLTESLRGLLERRQAQSPEALLAAHFDGPVPTDLLQQAMANLQPGAGGPGGTATGPDSETLAEEMVRLLRERGDLPQLQSGGRITRSGVAMVHAGETVVPATVDRSTTTVTIDERSIRDAVAEGVERAAASGDLLGTREIVGAIERHAGEDVTIEFRDQDRYREVRRG